MRRSIAACVFAVALLSFAPIARAVDVNPGDSCAGFAAGSYRPTGGPEKPDGALVVCDGSIWQPILRYSSVGNAVMFASTGLPAAPLHVWGEVIIGSNGLACSAATEGAIRFNSAGGALELCDGSIWQPVDSAGGISVCPTVGDSIISDGSSWQCTSDYTPDVTPDAFSFTDQSDVATGTVIESNIITITGMNAPATVSISGDGNPQFRVQSGSWETSAMINSGQTLQLRLTSGLGSIETYSAIISVGTVTDQWDVTTENTNNCAGLSIGGYCWYASGSGDSCDDICSTHGGCDLTGTRDYAGSSGTPLQCLEVLDALSLSYDPFNDNNGPGNMGCFDILGEGYRDTSTSCAGAYSGARRACACAE